MLLEKFIDTAIIEYSKKPVREAFEMCGGTIEERERSTDAEWMVVTRLSMQLVSAI